MSDKQAKIDITFSEFLSKIEEGIKCRQLSDIIESNRDNLPPGPALIQLMKYAKNLEKLGNKAIVGKLEDEIKAKLNEFKEMYNSF
ncbi:MAG: hypothetical protein ACFFAH_09225 [Promethearchaeota archaeon]